MLLGLLLISSFDERVRESVVVSSNAREVERREDRS